MKKTFKQFLQESAHEAIGLEIAQKIYYGCSDYLKTPRFKSALKKFVSQSGFEDKLSAAKSGKDGKTDALNLRSYFNGETLLHGDVNAAHSFKEVKVSTTREPKDTSKIVHDVVGDFMKQHFGHNYRSGAIFATGDWYVSSNYSSSYIDGVPCLLFPANGWSCLTSEVIHDMTACLDPWSEMFEPPEVFVSYVSKESDFDLSIDPEEFNQEKYAQLLRDFLIAYPGVYLKFKDVANMNMALTTGNEIMVAADKVYLLNPKFALTGYVLKHLADLMKV